LASSLFDIASLAPLMEQGQIFLTPNHRLARRIQSEWGAHQRSQGLAVWEPIPVFPLEHWLLSQWKLAVQRGLLEPRLLLSRLQEQQLWTRIIEEQTGSGEALTLLRPSAAAELSSEARDVLLRWDIEFGAAAVRQSFNFELDCSSFLKWCGLFDKELSSRSLCTPADAIAELAALARTGSALPGEAVTLIACEELAPLVSRCLHELSSSLRQQELSDHSASEKVHAYADARDELEGVARWAAASYQTNPAETIGIVLQGAGSEHVTLDYLLRREFDCLGENYTSLPVNFSAGIPLSRVPVVRDALSVLEFGLESVSISQVEALLRSRFLDLPDARTPLLQYFIRRLYEDGSDNIQLPALRNFANKVSLNGDSGTRLGECLLAMFKLRELTQPGSASEWSGRFAEILSLWGWPGQGALDSLEYQQVALWYETLEQFKSFDVVSGPLSYAAALQRLRDLCEQQISHPQTHDANIQVLGQLEAVGLSFDHLWVCGMQAGSWPSPPRPNPFIPTMLQASKDMPHATPEREWHFANSLLQQYRRDSGVVHFSYCQQTDGVPDLPSALIASGAEEVVPPGLSASEGLMANWQKRHSRVELESITDDVAGAPDADELEGIRGGAGLIEDQSQCPFRAFAHARLGVSPLPEPTLGLSASERGTIVHEALQLFWQQVQSHDSLLALTEEQFGESIARAAKKAVEAIPDHRRIAVGFDCIDLEESRLVSLLDEWLVIEKRRGDFRVAAIEQGVELKLSRLTIRLRVDRIDELADGGKVIIDYKTGVSKVGDWVGERPAKPQLLLYGSVLEEPPAALAFAQLRSADSKFVGMGTAEGIPGVQTNLEKVFKDAPEPVEWEAVNLQWQTRLASLAEEFIGGVARVDPQVGACRWCGMQSLCRIDSGVDSSAGELDDGVITPVGGNLV
jgi:ATP-dependent helicase/nuclease subunit B